MDIYESTTTALKIPFFPLGLCFPAGDVLDAVMVNWMVSFSAPLLLFSQSLFSTFLLFINYQ
ncbi:MAG TPA: hypothetical protein PLV30_07115 [Candidatus Marinimicrobia bacterium]|nr:hypothetical protein [Candidatus Neomarinimicrobiota bacterium]